MKIFIFYTCFLLSAFTGTAQQKLQEVNAVLHDESYTTTFGVLPDASINEHERIQLHLSYVEQLLRTADAANLTSNQQANRATILDLLHQYWTAGTFPTNRAYPGERRPCFIDAEGNICAVGYLIEQTKGRQLAEDINAKHQYDFLLDMKEPAIEAWADEYGLTLEECAMIQPAYGPPPPAQTSYADIKTGYGISSGLVGGTNIAVNIVNLSSRFKHNKTFSYIGLVTGAGQVIMGITSVKTTKSFLPFNGYESYTSYKAQNNLSYINIAMGTTTIITSALNLVLQKKIQDKRTTLNLYSHPNYNSSVSMGLSFTRKIY
ncbi:MAG: hypothetical protein ACXWC7_13590 [Chitinophagaceae bacterium]